VVALVSVLFKVRFRISNKDDLGCFSTRMTVNINTKNHLRKEFDCEHSMILRSQSIGS